MGDMTRKARAVVLQALYEVDASGHDPQDVLIRLAREARLSEKALSAAQEIVLGVGNYAKDLDAIIQERAPSFPVGQLAVVDRNILRIAIWEVLFDNKVPPKVAINEAVELAKNFGAANSYRFVNGVMGSIMATKENNGTSLQATSKGRG